MISGQVHIERVLLYVDPCHRRPFPRMDRRIMVMRERKRGLARALFRRHATDTRGEARHRDRLDRSEQRVHGGLRVVRVDLDEERPHTVVHDLAVPRDGAGAAHRGAERDGAAVKRIQSARRP